MEVFAGCEVRTYAFMDNHFHILLHVPERREISDGEVKRRVKILYGKKKFAIMEKSWEMWIEKGREDKVKAQLDGFRSRMYDLSELFVYSDLKNQRVLSKYRESLYYEGARKVNDFTGMVSKPGFARDVVDKVLDEGGELPVVELLHCKVRYFSDGVVIGSKAFVERMLNDHNDQFSLLRRKRGAKEMKKGEWDGLCTAAELRSSIISLS